MAGSQALDIPEALHYVSQITSVNPDCRGRRIGVLIVAYNAVTTLGKVLKRIPDEVVANVEEIVVFDDASGDDTTELAIGYKIRNNFEKLTIIKNEVNLGYGGNQKRGYRYFIDKGFDIVVLLHGDGQYAPEMLAAMYEPIVDGRADAVFGSRMMDAFGGPLKGGMPLYKLAGNRILTTFENAMLGMRLTEFHSGYRAYNLHALKAIDMGQMTNDFHFDTEIIIKLQHQKFQIVETPIPTYYGDELCYVDGMKYARNVFKSVIRYKQTVNAQKVYPEFSEYKVHYPKKEGLYSSHYWIPRIVGTNKRVLDVGCGEGFLAERLRAQNNVVVGVDALEEVRNRHAFQAYYPADLDNGLADVKDQLGDQRFDIILFADILEHLKAPERLLEDCRAFLKPNGRIIVSLPNVVNIYIRLQMLLGKFNYTARGILDETHLRFYTLPTARKLLERHGYQVLSRRSTVIPVELALGMSGRNPAIIALARLLDILTRARPSLLGYQHIFIARGAP